MIKYQISQAKRRCLDIGRLNLGNIDYLPQKGHQNHQPPIKFSLFYERYCKIMFLIDNLTWTLVCLLCITLIIFPHNLVLSR